MSKYVGQDHCLIIWDFSAVSKKTSLCIFVSFKILMKWIMWKSMITLQLKRSLDSNVALGLQIWEKSSLLSMRICASATTEIKAMRDSYFSSSRPTHWPNRYIQSLQREILNLQGFIFFVGDRHFIKHLSRIYCLRYSIFHDP